VLLDERWNTGAMAACACSIVTPGRSRPIISTQYEFPFGYRAAADGSSTGVEPQREIEVRGTSVG
jgi:hypothetical protein